MLGTVAGQQVNVLKDDGCNTNVMSTSFVNKNRHLLNIAKKSAIINHSNSKTTEKASEIVLETEVEIGPLKYRSNWIVADCRYDILLGMPWHVHCKPSIDYETGELKTGNVILPTHKDSSRTIKVQNIVVKKFRSLLRKKKRNSADFIVFRLTSVNSTLLSPGISKNESEDGDIKALKEEFSTVFRSDLTHGLPPRREVDHKIENEENSTAPHTDIFQLSPAELLATKEYITDLLRKGKIRPSKSPCGAPLCFVKQKGTAAGSY